MPNWNDNKVKIEGCDYEINRLLERGMNGGEEFLMNNFYPTPTKEDGEVFDGWYLWRVNNWGCKWDLSDVHMDRDNREINLDYQTPWGPNIEFWGKISKEFPNLFISLSYYEGGMAFGGRYEWEDGNCVVSDEYTVDDSSIEGWNEFGMQMQNVGFEWVMDEINEHIIPELKAEEEENNDEG